MDKLKEQLKEIFPHHFSKYLGKCVSPELLSKMKNDALRRAHCIHNRLPSKSAIYLIDTAIRDAFPGQEFREVYEEFKLYCKENEGLKRENIHSIYAGGIVSGKERLSERKIRDVGKKVLDRILGNSGKREHPAQKPNLEIRQKYPLLCKALDHALLESFAHYEALKLGISKNTLGLRLGCGKGVDDIEPLFFFKRVCPEALDLARQNLQSSGNARERAWANIGVDSKEKSKVPKPQQCFKKRPATYVLQFHAERII